MERKSLWKNFLLLTVGSMIALHVSVVSAAESTDSTNTSSDATDECVLEE